MKKQLLLIDCYGYVFRAHYANTSLRTSDNKSVAGLHGFINSILSLTYLADSPPDYVVGALDSGRQTKRREIFPDYKANRPPTPPELQSQLACVKDSLDAMNISGIELPGYEADDIISAFVEKFHQTEDLSITVISSDKDLLHLISYGVQVYDPFKKQFNNDSYVLEKFGILPSQMLDFLALTGDASDNIPGVKGIGPKSAAELLNSIGDLDTILKNPEKISKPALLNKIKNGIEDAKLSRILVSPITDFGIPSLESISLTKPDSKKLMTFLDTMEFKKIKERLVTKFGNDYNYTKQDNAFIAIQNAELFPECFISESKVCIIPFEGDFIIGTELHAIRCSLETLIASKNFKEFAYDRSITKICWESDDIRRIFGFEITSIEDLSVLSFSIFGKSIKLEFESMKRKFNVKNTDSQIIELLELHKHLLSELRKNNLYELYFGIDKRALKATAFMEQNGILLNVPKLTNMLIEYENMSEKIAEEIYSITGTRFNIGSPKQLNEVLFDKLGYITGQKNSKSGLYSTNSEYLESMKTFGDLLCDLILQWRQTKRFTGVYSDFVNLVDTQGKIRTKYMLTKVNTGRLSSTSPNLQNIPVKTEKGSQVRKCFIAESGKSFISADYSQIELRVIAHEANSTNLRNAFLNQEDVHSATALKLYGIVNHETRRKAKTINFGIIYGISSYGLAAQLGIQQREASHYLESYFAIYPEIKDYATRAIDEYKKNGYVKTFLGRKCFSDPSMSRGHAERAAINAPIQGGAADIMRLAMGNLAEVIPHEEFVMQVHDEIVFIVKDQEIDQRIELINKIMNRDCGLSIPLETKFKIGNNLGDMATVQI